MTLVTMTTRRAALGVAAVAATCALAACGSSSGGAKNTSSTAASASRTGFNRSTFSACLKKHGVTLPARPGGAGGPPASGGAASGGAPGGGPPAGGGFFGGGGARRFNNPKLRAAFQACGGANFRGRFRGRGRFRFSHTAINNFVACVRKHGYNLPTPNFSGKGAIFPRSVETNTKFRTASRACAGTLRPSGAAGAPPST